MKNFSEFIDASSLFSTSMVVVGWAIEYGRHAFFAKRTYRDEDVERLVGDVVHVETLSTQYWSSNLVDETARVLEVQIKGHLRNLASNIQHLEKRYGLMVKAVPTVKVVEFRRAVSGGEFEQKPHVCDPDRILQIVACSNDLKSSIRDCRRF